MNAWLDVNIKRLNILMRTIEEYRLKGSYGGNLDLSGILKMFKGAITEINRLEAQVNFQNNKIKDLENELKEYKIPITDKSHNDLIDKIDTLKTKMENVNKLFKKSSVRIVKE